jgi:hypothetical protein
MGKVQSENIEKTVVDELKNAIDNYNNSTIKNEHPEEILKALTNITKAREQSNNSEYRNYTSKTVEVDLNTANLIIDGFKIIEKYINNLCCYN